MTITSIRIQNYKSFTDSGEIRLTNGFNVILGPNNCGKTALAEALSLHFSARPHRSLATVPHRGVEPERDSVVTVTCDLSGGEFMSLAASQREMFVPILKGEAPGDTFSSFERAAFRGEFHAEYRNASCVSGYLQGIEPPPGTSRCIKITGRSSDRSFAWRGPGDLVGTGPPGQYGVVIGGLLQQRVYFFRAERSRVDRCAFGASSVLLPDASNLAEVLNILQTNPPRFERLCTLIATVFPEITRIVVPPAGEDSPGQLRVMVWKHDGATEREDLAIPLADSGVGIGQVLAILYVVLTADSPRTIVIDEPQTFLHPGALRKLIEILKNYTEHQFMVTTHSATVVSAAEPHTLLLLRCPSGETKVERLEASSAKDLGLCLAEVGARLSDVFGCDNILWVEGPTEESCFPIIVRRILKRALGGTAILGVIATGDFEGKRSRLTWQVYRRLSGSGGLLPPALAFVFDREGRSSTQREDLVRESGGSVRFLPRRTFENYLLKASAIAAITSTIDGFRGPAVTERDVEAWLETHRWDATYFDPPIPVEERTTASWLRECNAPKLLTALFADLSDSRVKFEKTIHGVALAEWLIENDPSEFQELAKLVEQALPPDRTSLTAGAATVNE